MKGKNYCQNVKGGSVAAVNGSTSVAVAVMNIREMWVRVCQILVSVGVRMRFSEWIIRSVSMSVMFVVRMEMVVLQRLVSMLVLVPFGQMQPDTGGHEHGGNEKSHAKQIAQDGDSRRRSDERRG